jgi:dihydroorotate dehydrogenase electron transfer subunit
MSNLHVVRIEKVTVECYHTKTFRFRAPFDAEPGQFVMVWVPRHDEVPMALSYVDRLKGFTSHAQGETTNALAEFKVGDRIGIRGPLGNRFDIRGRRILFVAGGTGMASVAAAMEAAARDRKRVVTALGAKTKSELIFVKRARKVGELHLATDDGSEGFHGTASAMAEKLMGTHRFDQVITCGPEVMMKKVVDVALRRRIPVQASVERFMRCGIGVCDACSLGDRLVCADGPVFDGRFLAGCEDFGRFRRDESGRKTPVK